MAGSDEALDGGTFSRRWEERRPELGEEGQAERKERKGWAVAPKMETWGEDEVDTTNPGGKQDGTSRTEGSRGVA